MRQKKIIFYIPSFERGGIERTILRLSDYLCSSYDIVILTGKFTGYFELLMNSNVKVIEVKNERRLNFLKKIFPLSIAKPIALLPLFISHLRKENADIVFCFQSSVPILILRSFIPKMTKLIVRESNTPSVAAQFGPWTAKVSLFLKKIFYPVSDHLIAISDGAHEDLINLLGKKIKTKLSTISNPVVHDDLFKLADQNFSHKWINKGINEVPAIVSFGRLTKQKNLETLIRGFLNARQKVNCRLIVLGDGPDKLMLENILDSSPYKDDVDFYGFVENPYPFVKNSDLYICTSIYEGLCNAVVEATALGVPSIVTNCPSGPEEIVMYGKAGVVVNVGDHKAVAKEIVNLIQQPEYAQALASVAVKNSNRFESNNIIEQYSKLINSLLEN